MSNKPPLPRSEAEGLGRALVDVILPAGEHDLFRWDLMRFDGGSSEVAAALIAFPSATTAIDLLNVLQNALRKAKMYDWRA